jgi:hypothetical protein
MRRKDLTKNIFAGEPVASMPFGHVLKAPLLLGLEVEDLVFALKCPRKAGSHI